MDTLPHELFLLILRHLTASENHDRQLETGGWNRPSPHNLLAAEKSPVPPAHTKYIKRLVNYITVSRRWQHALEHLFISEMATDNYRVARLAGLFRQSEAHRKAIVRTIRVNIVNPADEEEEEEEEGGESEEARMDRLFDEAIHDIFRALQALDKLADSGSSTSTCSSSSPGVHLRIVSMLKATATLPRSFHTYALPIGKTTTTMSLLPKLSSITEFTCGHAAHSINVSHRAGLGMASRLDKLRVLSLHCDEDKGYGITQRRRARQVYADAILSLPHSLQAATLSWNHYSVMDESQDHLPSILPDNSDSDSSSNSSIDPLNAALQSLCQRGSFQKLSLKSHVISPELFSPPTTTTTDPALTAPFWPSLSSISVSILPTAPDGKWYFTYDPSLASFDYFTGASNGGSVGPNASMQRVFYPSSSTPRAFNTFRSMPDAATMNPLLIAMARAARAAPLLELMKMEINDFLMPLYLRPAPDWFKRLFRVVYSNSKGRELRVEVRVDGWRMEGEVEREWKETMGLGGEIVYVYSGMEGERDLFGS
ncbi:hypothetical protein FQN50_004121 [Emmonsiellopsis sp. PD_5]|nr:hypothetical protein FQN50_004121 [Emmonsiellopsis sp. PD_5]